MTAQLIDGKATAQALRAQIAQATARATAKVGRAPGLAVVLVGDDPASQIYVGGKIKAAAEAGIRSFEHRLPADSSEDALLQLVQQLNIDANVDGILVQLPLPAQIDSKKVIATIAPEKDVDGFHVANVGALATGLAGYVPCTPLGCLHLIRTVQPDIAGLHAVVLGRSNIVGKPVAALLLSADATVTIAHSRTKDVAALCRQADILVAAVGRAEMVRGDWVKPGAIVIDVGMNRIERDGKSKLVGDVHFAEVSQVARAITPVPGGVGPMTIAYLLSNTFKSFCSRMQVDRSILDVAL